VILLGAVKQMHELGIENVTKTLLISMLLQTNKQYVRKFDCLKDMNDNSCWQSGLYINDLRV